MFWWILVLGNGLTFNLGSNNPIVKTKNHQKLKSYICFGTVHHKQSRDDQGYCIQMCYFLHSLLARDFPKLLYSGKMFTNPLRSGHLQITIEVGHSVDPTIRNMEGAMLVHIEKALMQLPIQEKVI